MLIILLLGALAPCSAFLDSFFSIGINCTTEEFLCSNSKCISLKDRCDGKSDCGDGSDEMACDFVNCLEPKYFRCKNDRCISHSFRCDGENDCDDFSDESNCENFKRVIESECEKGHWRCTDKLCIPNDWVCNGSPDCLDGSDETVGCSANIECDGFKCKNKYCVPKEFVCDGTDDCHDNSDEQDCENHVPIDQCTLENRKFLCHNNVTCIDLHLVCDELLECPDHSDEGKLCTSACRKHKCSHDCIALPTGPACVCPTGYHSADGRNCTDIDECKTYGICDQKCRNLEGSYECYCDDKYLLKPGDKKLCKAHGGNGVLVFSSKTNIRVLTLEAQRSAYITVAENLKHVVGVAYDGSHVYWSEIFAGHETIAKAAIGDDSETELVITSGLGLPEDLDVDWLTGNVYFTDAEKKHIGVCSASGAHCTVLINRDIRKPRGIVLNVEKGTMYWTDWGEPAQIGFSLMDGTQDKPFVTENIHWPNGLALDYPNERLYWTDAKKMTLESIALDGTSRRVVLEGVVKQPYAIAVFENKLYWSDWATHTIQTCDKFDGKNHHTLVEEKELIYGISVFHSALHKRNVNPCDQAFCSDICLLRGHSYSCACPENKVMAPDGHFCKDLISPQTLIVGYGDVLVHIQHQFLGKHEVTILPSIVKHIGSLAYNSYNNLLIISDFDTKRIMTLNMDIGTAHDLNINGLGRVSAMDYDDNSNNLYICDVLRKVVEVINLNSMERKILIHDTYGEIPTSIALVPDEGVMFVSFENDTNGPSHIDRFYMDGTGRTHTIDTNLVGPISITYDSDLRRIFFADFKTGIIESTSIEGDDRHHFRTLNEHPVGVASLKDDLFWVNAFSKELFWTDKKTDTNYDKRIKLGIKHEPEKMHLVSIMRKTPQENACRVNNSGCSHLCLLSQKSIVCACPVGWELTENNRTCVQRVGCSDKEFLCVRSNTCILKSQKCNGHTDCTFGEDEKDCEPKSTCSIFEFQCNDGECIRENLVCNHQYDCKDKSDEQGCDDIEKKLGCPPDHFTCKNGDCVLMIFRCDGSPDCDDRSDESSCEFNVCSEHQFRCDSGACIPKSWECDHQYDCLDTSDEHCDTDACPSNFHKCDNNKCIDKKLLCDGTDDCGDNSDEKFGECHFTQTHGCSLDEWSCTSNKSICIPQSAKCNGVSDCPKHEDEVMCSICDANEFECRKKHTRDCIPNAWMCDGTDDCGDGSDEDVESCSHKNDTVKVSIEIPFAVSCTNGFQCKNGPCINISLVCDGRHDCYDGSDEDGLCSAACDGDKNPCSQICIKTPTGPRCSCNPGYKLMGNEKTCEDDNECESEPPICSQICHNKAGGYSCDCYKNFLLENDKTSCKAEGYRMSLYFTVHRNQIRQLDSIANTLSVTFSSPMLKISDLDARMDPKTIYFSTQDNEAIYKVDPVTDTMHYIKNVGLPQKIAVDWATENIYYYNADSGAKSISVCNFEEKCAKLVDLDKHRQLSAMAVDSVNKALFYVMRSWSVLESPSYEIYKIDLDGSGVTELVKSTLGNVEDITFDLYKKVLYFHDDQKSEIKMINYRGGDAKSIFTNITNLEGLRFFENKLYYLREDGHIVRCKLFGKEGCRVVFKLNNFGSDNFVITQSSLQPKLENVCNKHTCSYLCISSNSGYKCLCHNGSITSQSDSCGVPAETENKFKVKSVSLNSTGSKKSSGAVASAILIPLFLLSIGAVFYYIMKKRSDGGLNISMRFYNPLYGKPVDDQKPILQPGRHEYANPIHHNEENFETASKEASKLLNPATSDIC